MIETFSTEDETNDCQNLQFFTDDIIYFGVVEDDNAVLLILLIGAPVKWCFLPATVLAQM